MAISAATGRGAIAMAVACALTALALGAAEPSAAKSKTPKRAVPSTPLWGFDSPSPGLGFPIPGDAVEDVNHARRLGSNVIRLAVRWDHLQPEPGKFHATRARALERVINRARKQEIGVMLTMLATPCWASSARKSVFEPLGDRCAHEFFLYPPRDVSTYGRFVKQLANRWGRDLSGIEVWNEPNHLGFWRGTPEDHVALAREARAGIRASRYRRIPVIGGALSGTDPVYLKRLLAAGIGSATDAISIHPYAVGFGFADPETPQIDNSTYSQAVPRTHETMGEYGNDDPIWITEFGYAECPASPYCVSAAQQAAYLRKAADLAAGWDFVDAFIVYRLRDWVPQDGSVNARFGVLRRNGSRKPAADTLASRFGELTEGSRPSGD